MFWKSDPLLYPPYLRSRIRRGKGIGQSLQYKPWISIRDVPSKGTSSSALGIKVQRPHHTLSELETTYLYLTERRPTVIDIREQWPIFDIDETLRLCSTLGVRHAFRGAFPEPFTIDFLLSEKIDGKISFRAASIKSPEDARDADVQRRLAVEYLWCKGKGIPWVLVDTSSFNKTLLSNLRFMRAWFRNRYTPDLIQAEHFAKHFLLQYRANVPLRVLLDQIAKRLSTTADAADDLFSYCAWSDLIQISLRHPLSMNQPLVILGYEHA